MKNVFNPFRDSNFWISRDGGSDKQPVRLVDMSFAELSKLADEVDSLRNFMMITPGKESAREIEIAVSFVCLAKDNLTSDIGSNIKLTLPDGKSYISATVEENSNYDECYRVRLFQQEGNDFVCVREDYCDFADWTTLQEVCQYCVDTYEQHRTSQRPSLDARIDSASIKSVVSKVDNASCKISEKEVSL